MTPPAWHPAPAVRALIADANRVAPRRSTAGDGVIGDAAHGQRASDHNPDEDGTVDAADLTHDPAGGFDCHARFEELRRRRHPALSYVIFDGWWFRSYARRGVPAWTLMPYRGDNKHRGHMHVSVLEAHQNDTSPWFATIATPPEVDDMFTADDAARLKQTYAHVTGDRGGLPGSDPALLNEELGAANRKLDAIARRLEAIEAELRELRAE